MFLVFGVWVEVTNKWDLHGRPHTLTVTRMKAILRAQSLLLSRWNWPLPRSFMIFWAHDTPVPKEYFTKREFQVQHRPSYPGGNWSCRLFRFWTIHRCQVLYPHLFNQKYKMNLMVYQFDPILVAAILSTWQWCLDTLLVWTAEFETLATERSPG